MRDRTPGPPGPAVAFGIWFYETSPAEKVAGARPTGSTTPFIHTPAGGFQQPQTFEISIPCLLTERCRKNEKSMEGGRFHLHPAGLLDSGEKPFAGSGSLQKVCLSLHVKGSNEP